MVDHRLWKPGEMNPLVMGNDCICIGLLVQEKQSEGTIEPCLDGLGFR